MYFRLWPFNSHIFVLSKSGLRKNFKELLNEIERRQERSLQREPLLSSNFMDRVSDVSVKRPWEMSARKLVFFYRILRSGQLGLYIKAASSFWLWHHKEKSVNKLVPSLLLRRSSFVVPDHRALWLFSGNNKAWTFFSKLTPLSTLAQKVPSSALS